MNSFLIHFFISAFCLFCLIFAFGCDDDSDDGTEWDDGLDDYDCGGRYDFCTHQKESLSYYFNECGFSFIGYSGVQRCYQAAMDCDPCLNQCFKNAEGCQEGLNCLSQLCEAEVVEENWGETCDEDDFYDYEGCPEKPNIYLYPEKTTDVSVELSFAEGSYLTASLPDYGNGWDVTVEPSGRIDGMYPYLFYEAGTKGYLQDYEGVVVCREELFDWLESYLFAVGFIDREVGDFMLYWTGELEDRAWYAIYPQWDLIIDEMIGLSIDPAPESVMRLWLVIEGFDQQPDWLDLKVPAIVPFEREGFTVVEWGVIRRMRSERESLPG